MDIETPEREYTSDPDFSPVPEPLEVPHEAPAEAPVENPDLIPA